MAGSLPQVPSHRFLTFFGLINLPSTNNLRAALCGLVNEGAKQITILFASAGGSVDDGIALYTYLKALPVELTMHAVGNVNSIALPVFLAASNRLASQNARFLFHNYLWTSATPEQATPEGLAERALILSSALDWTREILKTATKLTDSDFEAMKLLDKPVLIEPSRAVQVGIVSAIAEPSIPANSQPRVVM